MDRFKIATIIVSIVFCGLLSAPLIIRQLTYVSLIPAAGAIATVYFALIKYWIDSDLMFKTLFKEFNERFDLLNEDLNNIVKNQTLSVKKTSDQIIQDYLNLCAEEYYWFKKGRIPNAVWISWLAGINTYITDPSIKTLFKDQSQYDTSYYGFLSTIKNNLL